MHGGRLLRQRGFSDDGTSSTTADDIRPLVRIVGKDRGCSAPTWCATPEARGARVISYPASDGKTQELRLPVEQRRVPGAGCSPRASCDGSEPVQRDPRSGYSDLYVVPVYRWAFINPWAGDELDIVCRYADKEARPAPRRRTHPVRRRRRRRQATAVAARPGRARVLHHPQRNDTASAAAAQLHQSAPSATAAIARQILRAVSASQRVKYCSEVATRRAGHETGLNGHRVEQ